MTTRNAVQAQAVLHRPLTRPLQSIRQLLHLLARPEAETRRILALRVDWCRLLLAVFWVDATKSADLANALRVHSRQPHCQQSGARPGESLAIDALLY